MVTTINRKYDVPQDTDSMTDAVIYIPVIWFEHKMMSES